MTVRDFYEGPCGLCRAYIKKRDLENQRADMLAWMQGAYVYEALIKVAPIYHTFAPKGTKPGDYADKPRFFTGEKRCDTERRIDGDESKRVQAALMGFMRAHNKKMRAKEPKPEKTEPEGGSGA